jgi:hypothetical protein
MDLIRVLANGLQLGSKQSTCMRHLSTRYDVPKSVILAVVTVLGLALILCLIHVDHDEAGMDMAHGGCGAALVAAFFTAGVVLASLSWWFLPGLTISAYAVCLHLPDPPPKSPALL